MRRFVILGLLFLFSIPFGISIAGCGSKTHLVYCNGGSSGPIVGQANTITLSPKIYGVSLNFSQIGQVASPSATDCKGSTATVTSYVYGTFDANGKADLTIADVNPSNGQLCGGTWNRNTGGAIPDYTTCNPTNKSGTVYVVATANGITSNPLPVFVHPQVTSIVLGNPTPPANCATDPDPSSNCCPLAALAPVTAPPYDTNSCLSQGQTAQLVGRVYRNATHLPADNITCISGHLSFTTATQDIVSIDENGVATSHAPGSTVVNATLSNAAAAGGFISSCAPANISLVVPPNGSTSAVINQNNTQPLTAVVTDTHGLPITGLTLQYISTTPATIPSGSSGTITPIFPGAASITAVCQPSACNPAPTNQIGLLGNGTPITSNAVNITTPGTNSTLLYIASTKSLYLVPVDFTNGKPGTPVRLPYIPNSMVISTDGSSIYMGSANEIITFDAIRNTVSKEDPSISGNVLAISPDGTTLVITDPIRQLIYLYASAGSVVSTYSGIGTHAQFSPDGQTVYITTGTKTGTTITPGNQLLVHSNFTGWTPITLGAPAPDVTVTEPTVGAYLAGTPTTARSYCPNTTISGSLVTNEFYPIADSAAVTTDRITATNDGKHILGATLTGGATIVDLGVKLPIQACPATVPPNFFTRTSSTSVPLPGVTATALTGIQPTSDSTVAFVTYTGSGNLPAYIPATGVVTPVTLTGATAPVAAVISSDNSTVFVGTSGDNKVHLVNTKTLTDDPTKSISPNLPAADTTIVTPDLLVQHPRKSTS